MARQLKQLPDKECPKCSKMLPGGTCLCICGQTFDGLIGYPRIVVGELDYEAVKSVFLKVIARSGEWGLRQHTDLPFDGKTIRVRMKRKDYLIAANPFCIACRVKASKLLLMKYPPNHPKKADKPPKVAFCTKDYIRMTLDHTVPRAGGGKDTLMNFKPMCAACNFQKDDMPLHVFLGLKGVLGQPQFTPARKG